MKYLNRMERREKEDNSQTITAPAPCPVEQNPKNHLTASRLSLMSRLFHFFLGSMSGTCLEWRWNQRKTSFFSFPTSFCETDLKKMNYKYYSNNLLLPDRKGMRWLTILLSKGLEPVLPLMLRMRQGRKTFIPRFCLLSPDPSFPTLSIISHLLRQRDLPPPPSSSQPSPNFVDHILRYHNQFSKTPLSSY